MKRPVLTDWPGAKMSTTAPKLENEARASVIYHSNQRFRRTIGTCRHTNRRGSLAAETSVRVCYGARSVALTTVIAEAARAGELLAAFACAL